MKGLGQWKTRTWRIERLERLAGGVASPDYGALREKITRLVTRAGSGELVPSGSGDLSTLARAVLERLARIGENA